ncbi:MAG: NADH:flavin oxidoreductase/NADH oxidase [Gemmatimonadaceae bacterium]
MSVPLFTPFSMRDVTMRNRIAVSPMCEYSSVDGFATDWHLVHLGSRAVGGAGLVFTEATAVTADGRISPSDLGIYHDEHVEMLSRITAFIHSQETLAGIQLAHAGRKASTEVPWKGRQYVPPENGGWNPVHAPSPIAFDTGYAVPEELDAAGIRRVRQAFVDAARRAYDAGFDVIEIHAAHGYLLDEFLSPLSNHRTDEYGGSPDNRMRLVCEIVEDVRREAWPDRLPVVVRISATDWVDGGWDIDQSVELAGKLKSLGVDLIDCSSGGNSPAQQIPTGPGYQVQFAERIRKDTGVPTGAVGLITEPEQANRIVAEGQADIVLLARQMLRDPYFPMHAADALAAEVRWPVQYRRAQTTQIKNVKTQMKAAD